MRICLDCKGNKPVDQFAVSNFLTSTGNRATRVASSCKTCVEKKRKVSTKLDIVNEEQTKFARRMMEDEGGVYRTTCTNEPIRS